MQLKHDEAQIKQRNDNYVKIQGIFISVLSVAKRLTNLPD